jgi:DNA-binding cell septation regulator SpoVG
LGPEEVRGRQEYLDVAHPLTSECRRLIETRVLQVFEGNVRPSALEP